MVSYKPNQNKTVLLLYSRDNTPAIEKEGKPEIIHYFNKAKGGVNVSDNMCGRYSCSRKTWRWPLSLLEGMINIAVINAIILRNTKQNLQTKQDEMVRIFLHQLARETGEALGWGEATGEGDEIISKLTHTVLLQHHGECLTPGWECSSRPTQQEDVRLLSVEGCQPDKKSLRPLSEGRLPKPLKCPPKRLPRETNR